MQIVGRDSSGAVRYFAVALRAGKISQLLVTRKPGQKSSQEWTGVTYPTMKAANLNLEQLNCGGK